MAENIGMLTVLPYKVNERPPWPKTEDESAYAVAPTVAPFAMDALPGIFIVVYPYV
jgi:hypothetical protein